MTYTKRLVCLANSWKKGGACVAGIEWPPKTTPTWVRPVSDREFEQLQWPEHAVAGRAIRLLDVVDVPLKQHRPHSCQRENHLIDARERWRLVGTTTADKLLPLSQRRGPLWIDGHNTGEGKNDKIPETVADGLDSSLLLVVADEVIIRVIGKVSQRGEKTQVRLRFNLGRSEYDFSVTDPVAHQKYVDLPRGEHEVDHSIALCVSLSEPSYGYRYKLAAGVLELTS